MLIRVGYRWTIAGVQLAARRAARADVASPSWFVTAAGWVNCARLFRQLVLMTARVPSSAACFLPGGKAPEFGQVFRNPALARSLREIVRNGRDAFYMGEMVDAMVRYSKSVGGLFERGELKPLEVTEFPVGKLPDAMKFMTRAAYRGKIVLNMEGERVRALPPRHAAFLPDRSYLVSGGASGFGSQKSSWLGPPDSQIRMTDLGSELRRAPARAWLRSTSNAESPAMPATPVWRNQRREPTRITSLAAGCTHTSSNGVCDRMSPLANTLSATPPAITNARSGTRS